MNLSNEKAYLDLLEQISGTYIEGRTRATQSQIVRRPVVRGGAMSALPRHG